VTDRRTPAERQLGEGLRDAAVIAPDLLESTLRAMCPAGLVACSIAVTAGLVSGQLWLVWICGPGVVGFLVSLLLARRGDLQPAIYLIIATATTLVTASAVVGSGLRDIGVLAYPTIVMFAGMTLSARRFLESMGLLAATIVFLIANQTFGIVQLRTPENPPWVDALIVVVVMSATIYAVWMLAGSARRSLATAHREISLRRDVEMELKELSTRDFLTGVFNRRFFVAEMDRLKLARHDTVSMIIADVDGLKSVNDELGHAAGDQLIIQAASLLGSVVRAGDVLARVGGDEFAILLPDTDAETAEAAVTRIESRIAEHSAAHPNAAVRLSIGTATSSSAEIDETLALADSRMYAKKISRTSRPRPGYPAQAAPDAGGAVSL
jgi:diguanylate cyclase (GGDEF)-like protein